MARILSIKAFLPHYNYIGKLHSVFIFSEH